VDSSGVARNLRCLVGRHQWCAVTNAGGYDADCWVCGKQRRVKAAAVHRDVRARYEAARARDQALANRDSYVLASGVVLAPQRSADPIVIGAARRR
jgi:hypothetical protein